MRKARREAMMKRDSEERPEVGSRSDDLRDLQTRRGRKEGL